MAIHTRRNIILKAEGMIRQKGFNAFRFSDIAEALDIRNAAIHYYFPSKTSLGEIVIEDELRRIEAEQIACQDITGEAGLKRLVRLFMGYHDSGEVCLNGALAGEFLTFTAPMQERIVKMQAGILAWMSATLEKGRMEGSFHFEGETADRAMLAMGTLMASLQLGRVLGPEVFARSVNRMLADLGIGWTVEQVK